MIEPTFNNKGKNKGVTLIELMIVMVIAAVLVGGIYTLFTTQQRSYFVQDQVAGIQQDARAALTFLARDIRMAGAGIGAGSSSGFTNGSDVANYFPVQCISTGQNYNFAIVPIVNNDSDGGNQILDGTDAVAIVVAVKMLGFVSSTDSTNKTITLNSEFDNAPLYITSETYAGKVFIVDGSTSDDSTDIILQDAFPDADFLTNEKVYEVEAIEYRVGRSSVTTDSYFVLRQNDDPLIGDNTLPIVEDMQIAYQLEGSTDWIYDDPADTWPVDTDFDEIRMVRINVTLRTAIEDATVADESNPDAKFDQPKVEDHTSGLNENDGFRRRVYTTVVKVRNL